MSDKKKKILICGLLLILIVIIVTIFIFIGKAVNKYNLNITIVATKDNNIERTAIELFEDGQNARIKFRSLNNDSYIIGKDLYYLKNNTYYIYKTSSSYRDLYGIIKKIKNLDKYRTEGEVTEFSKLLTVKEVNSILDALFFSKKTSNKAKANITYTNKDLTNFNLVINDVEGYDDISIDIKISKLDKNYTVNTSRIDTVTPGTHYSFENTDQNIYEIIK